MGISSILNALWYMVGYPEKTGCLVRPPFLSLPKLCGRFSMSVMNGRAFALPVKRFIPPVGGIMDVAKDGENILLFDPGDIKKLQIQPRHWSK